jgi:hypothetical protein
MGEKDNKIRVEESKKKDKKEKKKEQVIIQMVKEPEEILVRTSAFRAVNNMVNQPVPANAFVKVIFPTVQLDLASEYNPATSTFIPAKPGVYLVLSKIGFIPSDPNVSYRTRVEIRVNGIPVTAFDNDFFGAGVSLANGVQVSTILQLQANEHVEVFASSNVPGMITSLEDGSRFEAARFPSPTA